MRARSPRAAYSISDTAADRSVARRRRRSSDSRHAVPAAVATAVTARRTSPVDRLATGSAA
jgi:hypothetical protein